MPPEPSVTIAGCICPLVNTMRAAMPMKCGRILEDAMIVDETLAVCLFIGQAHSETNVSDVSRLMSSLRTRTQMRDSECTLY